jgi:hypothetical protein
MQSQEMPDTRHNSTRTKLAALAFCFLISSVVSFAEPAYPLKTSANKRYLVDQNDVPFLMQGDAAWSLIVAASDSEVEQYLNNRRQKGFNTIMINLI